MAKRREKQIIIPPRFGWREKTWYLVEVSYGTGNPIHHQLFYTGYLNGDEKRTRPGGYNFVTAQGDFSDINRVYYLKAIKVIISRRRFEMTRWIDRIRKWSWRFPPREGGKEWKRSS